jgi:Protein of unknown function (DUF4239)
MSNKRREGDLLAQVPTVVLGILFILLAVALAVAGTALVHNRVPNKLRESHTVPLGLLNVGLTSMFGIIIGLTSFLVLGEYSDAQQALQSEAGDVEEIYWLAGPLPEPKQEQIQGLAASYARVVVNEEWALMEEDRTSPRADALIEDLRSTIQEGYRTSSGAEQDFFGEELDVMDELESDREARVLAVHQRLPSILWIALVILSLATIGFSSLAGMENRRLHLLTVGVLATGITVAMFTIGVLDRPFGTDFRVQPQPFELLLHEIEGNRGP